MTLQKLLRTLLFLLAISTGNLLAEAESYLLQEGSLPPVEWQTQQAIQTLDSPSAPDRAGALEQLGFMRAYEQADTVSPFVNDPDPSVRREPARVDRRT